MPIKNYAQKQKNFLKTAAAAVADAAAGRICQAQSMSIINK